MTARRNGPATNMAPACSALSALVLVLVVARSGEAQAHFRNDSDPVLIAGHVATGFGASSPYVFGQVGVRISERHLMIGAELSSLMQAGFALDALLYIVREHRFTIHIIDPGVGWNAFGHYLSNPDVKRSLDLRLGVGFELRVCRHAYLTTDWKVSLPDPGFVIQHYGDYGKTIFFNSLKESTVWIGVLIH